MPRVIGVVNITPDSFSDGGLYLDPGKAIEHAERLHADGADWAELGPASSHPDATPIDAREEIRRLEPVLVPLVARDLPVAVDSFQPETQAWALRAGATLLNDIRGFRTPELHPLLAQSDCLLVVMHSIQRGPATRATSDVDEVLHGIEADFAERLHVLTGAGIARERIVLDPGMGFFLGNRPEASVRVLQALPALRARFEVPLLVSVSRKSFLGALSGRPTQARGAATLAAELYAARQGVDYIRTHDVRALRDALAVQQELD